MGGEGEKTGFPPLTYFPRTVLISWQPRVHFRSSHKCFFSPPQHTKTVCFQFLLLLISSSRVWKFWHLPPFLSSLSLSHKHTSLVQNLHYKRSTIYSPGGAFQKPFRPDSLTPIQFTWTSWVNMSDDKVSELVVFLNHQSDKQSQMKNQVIGAANIRPKELQTLK